MKKNLIITIFLALAILLVNLPSEIYGQNNRGKSDLILSKYDGKAVEEVYSMKKNESKEDLLKEFKEIENVVDLEGDVTVLIPFAVALVEKYDSFTNKEILSLIRDEETGLGLESILIQMYNRKGGNKEELSLLLSDEKIDNSTKKLIIATNEFAPSELKKFFKENDELAISSMKKLLVSDLEITSEISKEILLRDERVTDEKLIASYIGIGEYYYKNKSDEDKHIIVEKMKADFKTSKNEILKDNIIYSLAKMRDLDIFKYIINNDEIDKELKISAIERNLVLLLDTIANDLGEENLDFILNTMKIHPITDIGYELEKLINNPQYGKNKKLLDTVNYIEKNGIKGVFKYE